MKVRLKATGGVLMALVALAAITAPPALAEDEQFHSEVEPTVITGHSESNQVFVATATLTCSTMELAGTIDESTADGLILQPKYSGCFSSITGDITWDTQGCAYVLHGSEVGNHSRLDIECETEHQMVLTSSACNIYIGTQTDIGQGVAYSNVSASGKEAITTTITATSIDVTKKEGPLCFLVGNTMTYSGNAILEGYEDEGTTGNITDGNTAFHEGARVDIWWE